MRALAPAAAALLGVILLRGALTYLRRHLAAGEALRQRHRIRSALMQHLHAAGPARLADWHSADLASRALHAVDAVEPYIANYLPSRQLALLLPLLIGTAAALHDWLAGLLLVLSAPLIPLFMALIGWGAAALSARFESRRAQAAAVFADHCRGLLSLRLFNAEREGTARVRAFAERLRDDSLRVLRVAFLSSAVLEFFAAVAVAAVAIYVGMGLLGYIGFGPAPELTLYSGLTVLLLAPELFVPLRELATHYHDRASALGAAEQLAPLFALPPMHNDESASTDLAPGPVAALEGVALTRDHGPVLLGLSLQAHAGELLLLWGPSGCGKSSVLHLLAGHLPPDAGYVTVAGGVPGRPGAVAWLGQRPFVARGSLRRNIALGRPDSPDAEIEQAARLCGVIAFAAALPEGLDTRIGERGLGLSGGQALRLALARAWLSRAPLLLLDEPTAGLDTDAAAPVLAAVQALRAEGRALVVASHDPQLRELADRVVDMTDKR